MSSKHVLQDIFKTSNYKYLFTYLMISLYNKNLIKTQENYNSNPYYLLITVSSFTYLNVISMNTTIMNNIKY